MHRPSRSGSTCSQLFVQNYRQSHSGSAFSQFCVCNQCQSHFDSNITAAASALIYIQRLCLNLASQPDRQFPGIQLYFPFLQGRFQEPRSEAHCRAQQLIQSRAPCRLAPFSPFALFALFPLFVFSPVPNSLYQALSSHLFCNCERPIVLSSFLRCFGSTGSLFWRLFWPLFRPFFWPFFWPLLGFLLPLISGQPVNTQSKNMSTISLVFVLAKRITFPYK
jgi:hypothetical protein